MSSCRCSKTKPSICYTWFCGGVAQGLEQSTHNRLVAGSKPASPTTNMLNKLKNFWKSKNRQQLTDVRNIGLYVFAVIVLAITWSGVKTLQVNYELQKQISTLKQQNEVLKLQNDNTTLQNQYYQTNQYLELAARQSFGLAAPGEKILLISKDVAMKYVDPSLGPQSTAKDSVDKRSKYAKNLQTWRDFLLGRKAAAN